MWQNHTVFYRKGVEQSSMGGGGGGGGLFSVLPYKPTQIPICNLSHIKQKKKIAHNKSRSTSARSTVQLQNLDSKLSNIHITQDNFRNTK